MRTRPGPLLAIAWIQLLAPFGSLWVSALVSNQSFFQFAAQFWQNSPWEFAFGLIGIQVLAALSIYWMKIWSLPLVIGCFVYQIYSSSWGGVHKLSVESASLFLVAHSANLALILYFLLPTVRHFYTNKRMRWWESKPRYLIDTQARLFLGRKHGQAECHLFEISREGAFIREGGLDLQVGDQVALEFSYEGVNEIFKARVVHRLSDVVGIRYVDLGHAAKKRLKELLRHLEYSDVVRKPERVNSIDEFRHWLRYVLTTGKGLLPTPLEPTVTSLSFQELKKGKKVSKKSSDSKKAA